MSLSSVIQRLTYLSLLLTLLITPVGAWPQTSANLNTVSTTTLLVSVSYNGGFADSHSSGTTISPDGRFVAFESYATNLVQGGANLKSIYFRDLQIGKTELVSVSTSGGQTGGNHPALSADGRFVAFDSLSLNLTPNDTNNCYDVFLRDRQSGQTERISVSSSNNQANASSELPVISADGRFVAFQSIASNLVAGDTNYNYDIFVRDRQAGTTELVSMASNGTQANSSAVNPSISADGRFVVFESQASNLVPGDTNGVEDIFVHDRQTHTTERLSLSTQGVQGNHHSQFPYLSTDGRFVVFQSFANNLVPNDTNGYISDIFLHDRQTGKTEMISRSLSGTSGNDGSSQASISDDGRWVAFSSVATNLVANDTNGRADIFLLDRQSGQIERASISTSGAQANGASSRPRLAANGSAVVFDSAARNLVAGDTNGVTNIFLHQVRGASTSGIIHVQDAAGQPESSAQVYIDGQLAGQTGADGNLAVTNLSAGQRLVARKLIQEIPSAKGNHNQGSNQNWAYRVYITSLAIPAQTDPEPVTVQDPNQPQTLTLQASQPLIGFNLVVSIEWDANAAYIQSVKTGLESASAYLYDASNGQMLIEQAIIYDNKQHAGDADISFFASNQEQPHADNILGLFTNQFPVKLGRYWDGHNANQGDWDQYIGYSSIIHEFSHYSMGLYDSYKNEFGWETAHCTGPEIRTPRNKETNATLMDYSYNATEYSMRGVPGLWSDSCTHTLQYRVWAQSDWETILTFYNDLSNPARWQLEWPTPQKGVVIGPSHIPIISWTNITIQNIERPGLCDPPVGLIVQNHLGLGAKVWLGLQPDIYQGRTDRQGRITLLGTANNDWVFARLLDWYSDRLPLYARAQISCPSIRQPTGDVTITLQPAAFNLQAAILPGVLTNQPILKVRVTPTPQSAPQAWLSQTGSETIQPVSLDYDPTGQVYTATLELDPSKPLSGMVRLLASDQQGQSELSINEFALNNVPAAEDKLLFSFDGVSSVFLPAGTFSRAGQIAINQSSPPGPVPINLLLLSGPYSLQGTPGITFNNKGTLSLSILDVNENVPHADLNKAALYRWDGQAWQPIPGGSNPEMLSAWAEIDTFGIYALLAEREEKIYLPVLTR